MVASNPGHLAAMGDPLRMRTYELFFEAIALFLKAEVTLVAEAAFQYSIWWRGLEPLTGLATLMIIRCRVPDEVARERQQTRLAAQLTRTAHADTKLSRWPGRSTPSMSTPPHLTSTPVTAGILAST
jgi:hypothetical protein